MSIKREASAEHRLLIDLCLRYLVPFLWQGPGLLAISRRGLDAILVDLVEQGIDVIGMEAFELDGNDVHPRLDLIFDAGRLPGFPGALDTLAVWPDDVWVDVTTGAIS